MGEGCEEHLRIDIQHDQSSSHIIIAKVTLPLIPTVYTLHHTTHTARRAPHKARTPHPFDLKHHRLHCTVPSLTFLARRPPVAPPPRKTHREWEWEC